MIRPEGPRQSVFQREPPPDLIRGGIRIGTVPMCSTTPSWRVRRSLNARRWKNRPRRPRITRTNPD